MRRQHTIRFMLTAATIALVCATIIISAVVSLSQYRSSELRAEQDRLKRHAGYLARENRTDRVLDAYGSTFGLRITVIDADGTVRYDNHSDPLSMDNHLYREEVKEALASGLGESVRKSATLGEPLIYEAVRTDTGRVIRVSSQLSSVKRWTAGYLLRLFPFILLLLAAAIAAAVFSVRHITEALKELTDAARDYHDGQFGRKVTAGGPAEISLLSSTLNGMAEKLQRQFDQLESESRQYQAILNAMDEGVILLGPDRRILLANRAFNHMFANNGNAERSLLGTWIFDEQVQAAVVSTLNGNGPIVSDLTVSPNGIERNYYLATTAPVVNADYQVYAVVVTFSDITKMRRLEMIRKDFVANVSHELKTPLTSIGGFAEVLLTGNPTDEQAKEFVRIIHKNTRQMQSLVEDLLLLASLEDEKKEIPFASSSVGHIVEESIQRSAYKAKQKAMAIESRYQRNVYCMVNENLIIQALVNLLLNAILYSEPNTVIQVSAEEQGGMIVFSVRDRGCGIAAENIERIFERFYRVDKARSRREGGTGLGLSIVKHIASIHGGTVTVESTVGEGSVFSLVIPQSRLTSRVPKRPAPENLA